jgi:YCII-related domain
MRVMLMIKGDPEPGAAPSEELLTEMGSYNEELQQAGVLLDLAGLLPSAEGRRVTFAEGNRTVIDGPFPESKQLGAVDGRSCGVGQACPVRGACSDLPRRVRRHGRDRDTKGVRAGGI